MSETCKTPGICRFTEKEFFEEINRFREACGTKTFWARTEEQQHAMIAGLTFLYLNLGKDDGSLPDKADIEKWGQIFSQALENYDRRKTTLALLPLKQLLGRNVKL